MNAPRQFIYRIGVPAMSLMEKENRRVGFEFLEAILTILALQCLPEGLDSE